MHALGHQARRTLLTLFVVSPLARESGRRSGSTLCMASGSTSSQPGWVTLIDESIRKNDVAHKNFGTPAIPVASAHCQSILPILHVAMVYRCHGLLSVAEVWKLGSSLPAVHSMT